MERKILDHIFESAEGSRYLKIRFPWSEPTPDVMIRSIGSGGSGARVPQGELSQPGFTRPAVIERTHDAPVNGNGHVRPVETAVAAHTVRGEGGDTAAQASLNAQRAERFVHNPIRHRD